MVSVPKYNARPLNINNFLESCFRNSNILEHLIYWQDKRSTTRESKWSKVSKMLAFFLINNLVNDFKSTKLISITLNVNLCGKWDDDYINR